MKAKLVEKARGMMILPEFQRKFDVAYGEDMLRRVGTTQSYTQIISKYREEKDLTRHVGYGGDG